MVRRHRNLSRDVALSYARTVIEDAEIAAKWMGRARRPTSQKMIREAIKILRQMVILSGVE